MSLQNFTWTKPKREAAALLADDELDDEDIAHRVGVTRQTLFAWKQAPEFAAHMDELTKEIERRVLERGIARRVKRIEALNERWRLMQTVIDERAVEMKDEVAGGGTGLLVRQYKSVGSGESARLMTEFKVDAGLLKELREHEKQAAQELGQWTEAGNMGREFRIVDETGDDDSTA